MICDYLICLGNRIAQLVKDDTHDSHPRSHAPFWFQGPGFDPRALRVASRSATPPREKSPRPRDPCDVHLRRGVRGRQLARDRGLLAVEAGLAQNLPDLAGRDSVAPYVPPRLLLD